MSNPAAAQLGSMRSDKKARASRANGKLGGRPRIRPPLPPGFKAHPKWDKLAANAAGDIMRLHNMHQKEWALCKQSNLSSGYLTVGIPGGGGRKLLSHHIVYECYHGVTYDWSAKGGDRPTVDHINGNKLDNRIENLQILSHRENSRKGSCTAGLPLYVHKGGRGYGVRFRGPGGKLIHSKPFKTAIEATEYREEFLAKHGRVLPPEGAY